MTPPPLTCKNSKAKKLSGALGLLSNSGADVRAGSRSFYQRGRRDRRARGNPFGCAGSQSSGGGGGVQTVRGGSALPAWRRRCELHTALCVRWWSSLKFAVKKKKKMAPPPVERVESVMTPLAGSLQWEERRVRISYENEKEREREKKIEKYN